MKYVLSKTGKTILLKINSYSTDKRNVALYWVDVETRQGKLVWTGKECSDLLLDKEDRYFTFFSVDTPTSQKKVWIYREGDCNATQLASRLDSLLREKKLDLVRPYSLSNDGSKLFVVIRQIQEKALRQSAVSLNVWSTADEKMQSIQMQEQKRTLEKSYLGVVFLDGSERFLRLQNQFESIEGQTDDFIIIKYRKGDPSEYYWNSYSEEKYWLICVDDGNRVLLPLSKPSFSSNGRYIVGYNGDASKRDLFVYDIDIGSIRNITHDVKIPLDEKSVDVLSSLYHRGLKVACWVNNDSSLLIYDDFDIWLIDILKNHSPVNLTNGRKDHWQFTLAGEYATIKKSIQLHEEILVTGFNKRTKKTGFYLGAINSFKPLKYVNAYNYAFEMVRNTTGPGFPLKAHNGKVFLVFRERCDEFPNIFQTTDFKTFTPVSQERPEKQFNWFNSELIDFRGTDGVRLQGILYKPDNFDSSKKYPLIIHYYDKKSDELNKYQYPVVSNGGEIDIAWFVSHEYLIFCTDINYRVGKVGESAKSAVEGAAIFLSRRTYINKKKIGIQGHSFGAFETNFIVTHSRMFSAAISSSGVCNITSNYGRSSGTKEYIERVHYRMGTTPWERPDLYVANSPIYFVGTAITPILLVNNKNDLNVPFDQGLEFFSALRRSGKKAWMLEYDNGGHGLEGDDYKDYLIRGMQFFDHYLKDSAAPKWMLYGIPVKNKGIDDGLELVREKKPITGKWITPEPGLLTKDEQKKVDALQRRKPITIKLN